MCCWSPKAPEIHDVHGNVWEWVKDCYKDSYKGAPRNGEAVTTGACKPRMRRGGSWSSFPLNLRSAGRNWTLPGYRYNVIGFRVARTLTP